MEVIVRYGRIRGMSNYLLEEDINKCVHYDCAKHECKDNNRECGMYNKASLFRPKYTYVRKPRWYEKYYKKDRFVLYK